MPLFVSPTTGAFTSRRCSLGALGDSYYEYLLKVWLLRGGRRGGDANGGEMYRVMWEQVGAGCWVLGGRWVVGRGGASRVTVGVVHGALSRGRWPGVEQFLLHLNLRGTG